MHEESKNIVNDAAGRSAAGTGPKAPPAASPPPHQMQQKGSGQVGITSGGRAGPGFITENLGKIMGAFVILLLLGTVYAFAIN